MANMMRGLSFLVCLAIMLATSHVSAGLGLRIPGLIRQPVDAGSETDPGFSCLSWRFGIETNNIRDFATVPKVCGWYVADYILGYQYREDSKAVTRAATKYANGLKLAGDGKDVWIFDVDETVLSHVEFFAQYGFGTEPVDVIALMEFMNEGISPALPESRKFYGKLLGLGFKVVFLTGRSEDMRSSTETNLKNAGYHTWEKVILRASSDFNKTQKEYKSAARTKLVESGYRILGNMGDQWSDLLGDYPGTRTFKLPNPMYYSE